MRLKSVYKELSEAIEIFKNLNTRQDYLKAIKKLIQLQKKIEMQLQKEEQKSGDTGKKLQHLMGWYLKLWDNKPPEFLKFSNPKAIIGKHLKELIQIYERNGEDIEALKRDYERFLETWKKGNRGILHFRSILPALKQNEPQKSWTSSEYERGTDYDEKIIEEKLKEEENPQEQGKQKLPFDKDDQIPF